jgi:CDP-6-deoxy-D-xylo-4-hexulose-3-dehydrase
MNSNTYSPGDIISLQNKASAQGLVLACGDDAGDFLIADFSELTQILAQKQHAISVSNKDLKSGFLSMDHVVRVDKITTIPQTEIEAYVAAINPAKLRDVLKRWSSLSTRTFSRIFHTSQRPATEASVDFIPGTTSVPYAGRVFNEDEVEAAVSATLDFWLTLGPEGEAFEAELSAFMGVKHSLLVNSGSSANLIAFSALTTHKLPPHKRIQPGDEVITVAAGFPTTVAPIIQCGAIPVFIDNIPDTGNIRVDQLENAYSEGKTKSVMLAHALGNPFDLGAILSFCRKYDLWLIEDNCDALGCTYSMPEELARDLKLDHLLKIAEAGHHKWIHFQAREHGGRLLTAPTGSWGDISTQSFYPPHHLTMGEGGAVNIVSRAPLKSYAESFRDWGRDCWCASGKDDTCAKRFGWQLGELPPGYDHKYIYSHLGYNLKPLDPQAAIGRQQLKKLPAFIEARKQNWEILRVGLSHLDHVFDFSLPTHATNWSKQAGFTWDGTGCRVDCSWFGFMVRVKPSAPFTHTELARHLEEKKIGNRMFFGGNLLRQPAFVQLKKDRPTAVRVVGDLIGADEIMRGALFLGTYPGLTQEMLNYEIDTICNFVASHAP